MHVYYKFGLLLIFILSVSICHTRGAPATNQSSSTDDYDDYDDYYEDNDDDGKNATSGLSTTQKPISTTARYSLFNIFGIPKRSNHVLEPLCPRACLCLEDYKYVRCSNARLTHVPRDLPSTALIIDLSQNRIKEMQEDDFANCTKVREINLSDNQLIKLDKQVFDGLHRLKRLRLSNNYLTHIEPDTFNGAIDLDAVDLSNNSITLRSDGSFLNQPGLLELSCRNCSWTEVFDGTFANLSSLTSLKLDKNDFNRKINTKAFIPLVNLVKLRLPELDKSSVEELCNVLRSIDDITFKHFDISCYELVLGTSYNESLILVTDPPIQRPKPDSEEEIPTTSATAKKGNKSGKVKPTKMATESNGETSNITLVSGTDDVNATLLTAGVLGTSGANNSATATDDSKNKTYQVPVSQETINIMLISIMVVAVIGLVIGLICRKDVGGIKTKCCRSRKPEPKDQVHPAEEIPLNKLG